MSALSELGRIGNERGKRNERHVLDACIALAERQAKPFLHFSPLPRLATPEEDARGIDVIVTSDVGPLFLQVKSSLSGLRYRKQYRKRAISVVIVKDGITAAELEQRVLAALTEVRGLVMSRRSR